MTAEGEDIEAEPMTVHECDPPRRLVLSWMSGATGGRWHVELDLAEDDGVTTLTFAQRIPDTATGRDVGPGWEYYLDRLTAAESGRRRRRGRVARLRGHGRALREPVRRPRLSSGRLERAQHVLGDRPLRGTPLGRGQQRVVVR